MNERINIEDLEKEVDNILRNAEEKKMIIIREARKKAEEILNRPIPTSAYESEAEKIIKNAEKEAEKIISEARKKAEKIKDIDERKYRELVIKLTRIIVGIE